MTKEILLERYKDYRKEIVEYMDNLGNALIDKYGEVPDSFIISLDLLVYNLEIMFKALEGIKEEGLTNEDRYHGGKKSSSAQNFFSTQAYIHKILGSFGFTPMSKSRIKENNEALETEKYLKNLLT